MLKIDLHTHTVNSGDGLNTLYKMAQQSSKKKLKIRGITPEWPFLPKNYPEGAYPVFDRVPEYLFNVRILMSAELNILDEKCNKKSREPDNKPSLLLL